MFFKRNQYNVKQIVLKQGVAAVISGFDTETRLMGQFSLH